MKVLNPVLGFCAGLFVAVALTACGAATEPTSQVEITSATVSTDIASGPSTMYEGHKVYLHGDRWYFQRDGSWVYYQPEPPALKQYREHLRGVAPKSAPPPRDQHDDDRTERFERQRGF